MKGFALDENGDVIVSRDIQMTKSEDLIRQTVGTLLHTNKKEWNFNPENGIHLSNFLTKNPDMDLIRAEIQNGLYQVDSTLVITSFEHRMQGRTLLIAFTAKNQRGQEIKINTSF